MLPYLGVADAMVAAAAAYYEAASRAKRLAPPPPCSYCGRKTQVLGKGRKTCDGCGAPRHPKWATLELERGLRK